MLPTDFAGRPQRVTVGIIDDYAVHLDSLRSWLARNAPDIDVVAVESSFARYFADDDFPPRVTIVGELRRDSAALVTRVRSCLMAGSRVVLLRGDEWSEHDEVLRAGAWAALPRKTPMVDIVQALRGAAAQDLSKCDNLERARLSPSEREALLLYTKGYTTNEVAASMDVQYETAKTFLRRARQKYTKLGRAASKRADLIARATEDGII